MAKQKLLQPLKGFRDFLPEKMALRNEAISRLRRVFEKYGFEELQTPALEYKEVLVGKYGEEAEKLMYLFKDRGERDIGLRYDLTIPLARVVSTYPDLPKPFKTYRIQPVWRAEKPQKGRYREFYQCDFDIIGTPSPIADAEIIAIINDCLKSLGFLAFKIKINNRKILFDSLKKAKIPKDSWLAALTSVDKLDKKPQAEVEKELITKGLTKNQVRSVLKTIREAKPDEFLEKTMKYAAQLGVLRNLVFEPTLARGLDYYTGPIYEAFVDEPKIGSVAGGGRYDKLISDLGGPDFPATGASIGIERVVDVIEELNLWKDRKPAGPKVLVTIFSDKFTGKAIEAASLLRNSGISTELYPDETVKLDKQLKYADKRKVEWAIIIGPKETIKNEAVLKNMATKKQETVPVQALLTRIK